MYTYTYFSTLLLAFTALTSAYPSASSLYRGDRTREPVRSADDTIAFLQGLTNNREDMSGRGGDPPEKYFHESTFHPHYDGRFAYTILPPSTRLPHLRALIRSYLSTMRDLGAETWIMHGSLLGWWWNRRIMPWDDDIDVQVSESAISFLARYYNMTVHSFNDSDLGMSTEDAELMEANGNMGKRYLLEVNPRYTNASAEDWLNVIDARWIDIDTGLFIDITALRVDRGEASTRSDDGVDVEESRGIDRETDTIPDFDSTAERRRHKRRFRPADEAVRTGPLKMYCKDKHTFLSSQIYPLRTSVFEDVPVRIPYAYRDLLAEEYGSNSLIETDFWNERYEFQQQRLEWVPMSYEKVQVKLEEEEREMERNNVKALGFKNWSDEQETVRKRRMNGREGELVE